MNTATVRQQLHHLIDVVDESKIMDLYHFFQSNLKEEKYSAANLEEFYNRLDKYEKGEMSVFSVSEAHNYIRTSYQNK